ncbi:MAG: hypothetical protein ACR2P1_01795 [Pseudomonadales bacterium]
MEAGVRFCAGARCAFIWAALNIDSDLFDKITKDQTDAEAIDILSKIAGGKGVTGKYE